ncbi:MAG: flagellar assembly peptidoglycan hydrolase FlgJ, partial [Proteobacteria bacterium]
PSKLADRLVAGIVPSAATEASAATSSKNLINVPASAPANSIANAVRSGAAVEGNSLAKSVAQPPLAPAKRAFGSSDEFIATMLPMAEKAAARIGVDPKVLVAQAALETGWGKSIMRADDGSNSHNLFGIKATGNWKGENARAITSEFRDGQMVKETADFRSYDSYEDSFHDLVSLLQNNDRYQGVVKSADNPEQFVKELQKAGYATDPNYASKISSIAKQMQGYENYARSSTSATTNL